MLHPWEVEEMFCVGQFYKVLMEELSDKIEEDFVTMVKEKIAACADVGGEQKDEVGGMLDWFGLWWYDESFKRSDRSEYIDYLVSRGMLFIRKLTSAPFPILNYGDEREEDEGKSNTRHAEDDSDEECLGHCNFGWLWAVRHTKMEWRWDIALPANYDLRNRATSSGTKHGC
ncbi:hypothetical protein BDV32DRAFT_145640 [Aspergillus pseudonomiae]|uniref:Uncharacterized protein n=1 Tax=Aspergillus pseudonomiae TaxID=1506151 RepID=A0A5N7DRZ0_9EURO|nr:uncharacterized protein BDV37DRAFT_278212 [Aspergillus pseudonomiae]KAB8264396.1 hypothetical protein BDV32DRAFT_145640 [Aspergillus pseudonomiae]KAE8409247.1 hypothetical protein BDV37DRAFT_278212 [Aspergillus pseudonomiae]